MSCEETFFKELRQHGFRLTPQREMVLSVMHQMEGLHTVDDIYRQVHEMSESVDISTVYRTLELLQEFDMVMSVDAGDGQRRFELSGVHGHHAHLVCRACGAVAGVDMAEVEPFLAHIREHYGFEVDAGQVNLPGLCHECQETADQAAKVESADRPG